MSAYFNEQREKINDGVNNPVLNPYIDMIPRDFNNFPIFFNDAELEELKGSPFVDQISTKKGIILEDYNLIRQQIEDFHFTLQEFSEMSMVICSRIFYCVINGEKMPSMVPYGDMLNHHFLGGST